jgi:hypothetical protein
MVTERVSGHERTAARVAAAQAVLAEQVAAPQSGEDSQRFLAVKARLHQYSPTSVILISVHQVTLIPTRNHETVSHGGAAPCRMTSAPPI